MRCGSGEQQHAAADAAQARQVEILVLNAALDNAN
jgi:hypothetical protein